MLRWIWTNNIFPAARDVRPPEREKSALVLAGRMSPTTGITGLELTFLTSVSHLGALLAIFKAPNPMAIIGMLLVMAACASVVLVAELRLVQITSITVLGFLGPIKQAATTLLYAPLLLGESMPPLLLFIVSAVFLIAGIVLFIDARQKAAQEAGSPKSPGGRPSSRGPMGSRSGGNVMVNAPTETYYRRMYAQEGQRRSDFV